MMPATILLVEDDPLFRETVRDTLLSAGYQVLEAPDGVAAVEHVVRRHPDLVLLDFDLPRMMGDEALSRMLQLRPGLICYVLSGKDDLNQALLMGRRGAYGWIDKYVGSDRLLSLVAEGLKTRPAGLDLVRLVATAYPQPVAAPFITWQRLDGAATTTDRLAALRELFEALVEYLGVTLLAAYLNRGLLEEELNSRFWEAIERPTPARWLDALGLALPRFEGLTSDSFWQSLAFRLRRSAARADLVAECVRTLGQQALLPASSAGRSVYDLLRALASYHSLWLTPDRLPPDDAAAAERAIGQALACAVAELAALCDLQLCWVEQATVTAEGDYAVSLDVLSGLTVQNRQLASATPLRQGELYLVSRMTQEIAAPVGPMMTYGRCEQAGLVSHGVFTLSQLIPNRRATYLSHTCGHLRWIDTPTTLEAVRHLYFQLNPQGDRYGHLLRDVAVGLFDLSGYTLLTRAHGPTVARELVRRMVSVVRDAAARHRGTVGDPVGDEVLVYFEQPEQAVRAAVETMQMLAGLNQRNPQVALRVHVGMDYGPGVVERNDVWGDVINRAKRCQSLAQADELVISSDLKQALGESNAWTFETLAGELKGFGQAEVYRVKWHEQEQP